MSVPILILLIAIPLLRPLRSPDPRLISDDEQARLATVQAMVRTVRRPSKRPNSAIPATLSLPGPMFLRSFLRIITASSRR